MHLQPATRLHGFTVLTAKPMPEIDGVAYTLVHDKSRARLLYLQNDDVDKSFSIAFKTPPADDTGVFHILEHSVLCGSEKFPVKEPFVNLLRTSMETFLNAMTFPDKTMYPVASTNFQDLLNLTDVYLDAVLHPDIYRKPTIFQQEGWHYELEGGTLACNGVVYNEMKGALSEPSSVLLDELQAALFPDTAYRFESGGTPEGIPQLTYERFLEEHARHYRLDNSYLTLYGDLDIDAMLAFLDERYLSPVADEQAAARAAAGPEAPGPRTVEVQAPVKELGRRREMRTAPENACMALGCVVGTAAEHTRVVAVDILLDAIAGSNEAPLKRALLDEGLADDVSAFLADGLLQPFAVVELRGLHPGASEAFLPVCERELRRLADGGLDHALVEASLSHTEFVMRERDLGVSDGVALSMTALSSWLYDDAQPDAYLRYEDDFAFLREALDTDYFEQLIRSVFLDNGHMAEAEIVPVEEGDDGEAARLAAVEATLDEKARARIAADAEALRRAQTEPDAPEALAALPSLGVADIGAARESTPCELRDDAALPCLVHDLPTRGIVYVYRYFDLNRLPFEDMPYVRILARVLGKLPTARHDAAELDTLVNGRLGSLTFFNENYAPQGDPLGLEPKFVVGASALAERLDDAVALSDEIMLTSDFSDLDKIEDVLGQMRLAMEQGFCASGHSYAIARVASYLLPSGVLASAMSGVEFYRFVKRLLAHFDEEGPRLARRLADVARRLFVDAGTVASFTGGREDYARFLQLGGGTTGRAGAGGRLLAVPEPRVRNEAFIVPTDVAFAAQGARLSDLGYDYDGTWSVTGRVLSYDYLWNEVRVLGGAYGCGFKPSRTGASSFYSYRDPHLDETLARFARAGEWLADFAPTRPEMEGYVVSTVADFDKPVKPRAAARRQDALYFSGRTQADRLRKRDEMLACDEAQVAAHAQAVADVAARRAVCVFGNRRILEESQAGLELVDLLDE